MWNVLTVERFDEWFLSLDEPEQISVLSVVKLLEIKGPNLTQPYVDKLNSTKKVKNLKELRIQHQGKPYKVFFLHLILNVKQFCYVAVIKPVKNVFMTL